MALHRYCSEVEALESTEDSSAAPGALIHSDVITSPNIELCEAHPHNAAEQRPTEHPAARHVIRVCADRCHVSSPRQDGGPIAGREGRCRPGRPVPLEKLREHGTGHHQLALLHKAGVYCSVEKGVRPSSGIAAAGRNQRAHVALAEKKRGCALYCPRNPTLQARWVRCQICARSLLADEVEFGDG
eukprot:7388104-Prymnesium_polylepis.3